MDDLISREALLSRYEGKDGRDEEYIGNICEAIRIAPTIDAAPVVHARWHDQSSDGSLWACSECGWLEEFPNDKPRRFCAGCGARMDADAPGRAGKDGRDG